MGSRRSDDGAGGETRTHTSLRRTAFEAVASTDSATPANIRCLAPLLLIHGPRSPKRTSLLSLASIGRYMLCPYWV